MTADQTQIKPLVDEATWVRLLSDVRCWVPPLDRHLLVLSPHPDDETLGAGGLISRWRRHHLPVKVIAVTDGEGAFPDWNDLAKVRVHEQEAALAVLGVDRQDIIRLRMGDGLVAGSADALCDAVKAAASEKSLLIAPWRGDFHPDHEACGKAAERVALELGLPQASYMFWAWHRGSALMLDNLPVRNFRLDDDLYETRRLALLHHKSQLEPYHGRTSLPKGLLGPAQRRFETYMVWE